jgi:dienelactone hydrolase
LRARIAARARLGRRAAAGHATLLAAAVVVSVVAAAAAPLGPVSAIGAGGAGGTPTSGAPAAPSPPFAVGLRVLRLRDGSRTIRLKDGRREPRTLVTYLRYPALGAPGQVDVADATPATAAGPYPLIVFGHGFAVTPKPYAQMLQSWARAGYVVASPVFPLGSADAPGGPDEADVINQPSDMSFVISSVLSLSRPGAGALASLVDPAGVAVAGHSDGGETALAVAYSRRFRDPRVDAAVILSGAEMGGVGGYSFTRGGPPLLAAQGTADRFNEPKYTDAYFKLARRPKFLLRLLGAGHLPPYTREQPQLAIVERVTIAFLDTYLKHEPEELRRLLSQGGVPRKSALLAEP